MSALHPVVAPETAHVLAAVGGYDVGSGRLVPTVAAVIGLASVVIGVVDLVRSRRTGAAGGQGGALLTVVMGLISVAVGGLHLANVAGGPGTGNGAAGAVAAVALGLVGMGIGGSSSARRRRYARFGAGSPIGGE